MSAGVMRRALEYAHDLGLPVMVHAEDLTLTGPGCMNEGAVATRLGLPGIPAAAEVAMVQRDLLLAEMTGAHLHVAHVSAAGTVRAIREAKARGVRVTAEATPHHFTLTDEAVAGVPASVPAFRQEDAPPVEPYDTHAKMSPPLRSESDRQAIVGALSDGIIDAVATDHAPHGPLEKDVEFENAANGVVGLETSLALTLALVRAGELALPRAVERLSSGPARCFGLPYGTLATGAPADVILVDAERAWKVDPQRFHSRSRNSPFAGRRARRRARWSSTPATPATRRSSPTRPTRASSSPSPSPSWATTASTTATSRRMRPRWRASSPAGCRASRRTGGPTSRCRAGSRARASSASREWTRGGWCACCAAPARSRASSIPPALRPRRWSSARGGCRGWKGRTWPARCPARSPTSGSRASPGASRRRPGTTSSWSTTG